MDSVYQICIYCKGFHEDTGRESVKIGVGPSAACRHDENALYRLHLDCSTHIQHSKRAARRLVYQVTPVVAKVAADACGTRFSLFSSNEAVIVYDFPVD